MRANVVDNDGLVSEHVVELGRHGRRALLKSPNWDKYRFSLPLSHSKQIFGVIRHGQIPFLAFPVFCLCLCQRRAPQMGGNQLLQMYASAPLVDRRLFQPGICFQANYSILHLDIPDNPSQPCLSCTKQWCLNQNLPICAGASLGDTDPDTATGKEGDVEARCFRTC
jgi:hypothetical protein